MNIGQWVHFSVDDVIECFRWIYENKPESIFEEPMLCKLKKWNQQYGLKCDLYVFERSEEFTLELLQDVYWDELRKESSWLKVAWHAPDGKTDMSALQQGTASSKKALESLERVHSLVINKAGANSWSNVVRLHGFTASGDILSALSGMNIEVLLTADREMDSYHLDKENMRLLNRQGNIWVSPFMYRSTDIRLDWMLEDFSAEQLLEKTQDCLRRCPEKFCLEIFFHERLFLHLQGRIDAYWKGFDELNIPLLINASVLVDNMLYFTTCNTCNLYAMDLSNNEVKFVVQLPCNDWSAWKYASLHHYNGTIWMIPMHEKSIPAYHLESRTITEYDIDFLIDREEPGIRFRKAIEDNNYLWLLPGYEKSLLRIDMEKASVKCYSDWPKELAFGNGRTELNFQMMCRYGRKLYLYKKQASHNVILDMDTGKMKVYGKNLPSDFGITLSDDEVLLSPHNSHSPVIVYNIGTDEKKEFLLPDWIWRVERTSLAFFYAKKLGDDIYIFPNDAKALIKYNIKNKELECLENSVDDYAVSTKFDFLKNHAALYDAWQYGGERYFLAYCGNAVLKNRDQSWEFIFLQMRIQEMSGARKESACYNNLIKEDENVALSSFLQFVKANNRAVLKIQE